MTKKAVSYLITIFAVFFLLLHYPFLAVINKLEMIAGIPALFVYLFTIWVLLIIACFIIVRRSSIKEDNAD